jgi:hypothetical protein
MSNGFAPHEYDYYENFLENFRALVRKSETESLVRCPDPERRHSNGDENPSLSVGLGQNGRGPMIKMNCLSQGCPKEKILSSIGLGFKDLYPPSIRANGSRGTNGSAKAEAKVETARGEVPGCTLEAYAKYKNLPVEFLTSDEVALEQTTYAGKPAVLIPYADSEGNIVLHRFRTGLEKPKKGPDTRMRNEKGKSPILYGLHRLEKALDAGYALLVEGESDAHVLWYRGEPAISVPGAKNWRGEWAEHLLEIPKILVCVEPDAAGEDLWHKVSSCPSLSGRLAKVVFQTAL